MTSKRRLTGGAAIAILLAAFFLAPVVPYGQSVSLPYNYSNGVISCVTNVVMITGSSTIETVGGQTTMSAQQVQGCLAQYAYPAVQVTGYATPSYGLLGLGSPPFPQQELVTQGNLSALLFFDGMRAVAGEVLGYGNLAFDPAGVEVSNASMTQGQFQQINLTVTIKNTGSLPVYSPTVSVVGLPQDGLSPIYFSDLSGTGIVPLNESTATMNWVTRYALGNCEVVKLAPGAQCQVSDVFNLTSFPSLLNYTVEASGLMGGKSFVVRQGFQQHIPGHMPGISWVRQFIAQVDSARGSSNLIANATLDRFAALRFATAVTQPDISDYAFSSDLSSFFGPGTGGKGVAELLLFPGAEDPVSYARLLQASAPGHWSALTDLDFEQYGYHVAVGQYEFVKQPCPVTEIPGPGINITQYFASAGCSVTVQQTAWLVVILGP